MIASLHAALYSAIALVALTSLGNRACRKLLALARMTAPIAASPDGSEAAGRIIGSLERLIIASGIIFQSWEIVAAVIALKSVARFKELDSKPSAEYFLVGSLFSLLWAMMITGLWLVYDSNIGIDLHNRAEQLLHFGPPAGEEQGGRFQFIS